MPTEPARGGLEAQREALVAQTQALLRRIEEPEQEKRDLEVMLETSTQHADHVSTDLVQERDDLATMLEMTTEHADTVTEELHDQAAAAVLRNEQQLRMIIEATPAAILISRVADGEIVYANAMFGILFRMPSAELVGRELLDFYYDPAERAVIIGMLEEHKAVDHHEVRFRQIDGTLMWVSISLRLLQFNAETAILSSLHDITERKQAAIRLQQQVEDMRRELEDADRARVGQFYFAEFVEKWGRFTSALTPSACLLTEPARPCRRYSFAEPIRRRR